VREFKNTICAEYQTFELPREAAARGRREQREANARVAATGTSVQQTQAGPAKPSKKQKTLNLNIYKWHAAGDLVPTIELFGTTDVYSTQFVSLFSGRWNALMSVFNRARASIAL
jgi:hypothetical protein